MITLLSLTRFAKYFSLVYAAFCTAIMILNAWHGWWMEAITDMFFAALGGFCYHVNAQSEERQLNLRRQMDSLK